ncbi:hypothetical protein F5Y17DRAFT_456128 [Xylariaceae sp. FL0594]|nr:hypothetical protein F5Y17DRAFT_456128 [Xylariaceae sp. FL0594]
MTHAHNVLIRGLNSILQQGPHVPTDATRFREKDVKDFLHYVHCWVKMVHHHHWVEETFMFPEMGKLSGKPGFMDDPRHQYETFQSGLDELEKYATSTRPDQYRWRDMEQIIGTFMELDYLDSEGYRKTWLKVEEVAKQSGNIRLLYDMVPMVLGCADKTYPGAHNFPPFP